MRQECEILDCGEPAVDYIEQPAEHVLDPPGAPGEIAKLYLCAEHWDQFINRAKEAAQQ